MEVHKWFENKDYWQGVELFNTLSNNQFLKDLFQSKSEYTVKKLEDELRKLSSDQPDPDPASEIKPSVNQIEQKKFDNSYILKKLKYDLQQVYRQIDSNRFALARCKSDKTRLEYAIQILKLVDRKRMIFEKIDYFDEHGELPAVATKPKVFTTPELQRLYVQVNKMEKRLQKPDDQLRNKAKSEQKLREKKARIAQLVAERKGGEL
ncbi:hypothetical protein OHD16_21435 [Sphingobacterium sp. ML3W]|uniref:hypothetical protein n=1 Tax=Sphingobacterium sp. ML3W TaxID=1538644 RepID=UPI00249A9130|nr:hypothetical protein [Sphingobacterium sp. ML3W]WFA77295.1 hypothetical protein OGI71_14575 [Sphingobacterium sp. ML3W]